MARILVVDDEIRNRNLLAAYLARAGHRPFTAGGGEEAVELAASDRPDLCLVDVLMPGLDGFETTRRLRALEQCGEVPPCRIVAHSSNDDSETRLNCLLAGMDGFVAKPLMVQNLRAELHRVCAGCGLETLPAEDLAA